MYIDGARCDAAAGDVLDATVPVGGRAGSASGIGCVGGRHTMESLTEVETVVIGG